MIRGVVSLEPVTKDNVIEVCFLTVAPDQEELVSDNALSLAEAYVRPEARPFAVAADDGALVGFAMLYDDGETPAVLIWRLMIDARFQRRGHGTAAVKSILQLVRDEGRVKEILVGAMPGEGGPAPFYLRLGFEATGEVKSDGETMYRLGL
jgi:diamine N-acetyltransferase